MSTERDELADMVGGPSRENGLEVADAILAAGYRKSRTVTTVEELDALKFEAVVLDSYGTAYVCLKKSPVENHWDCPALTNDNMPTWAIVDHGPFTVLHEGDDL